MTLLRRHPLIDPMFERCRFCIALSAPLAGRNLHLVIRETRTQPLISVFNWNVQTFSIETMVIGGGAVVKQAG